MASLPLGAAWWPTDLASLPRLLAYVQTLGLERYLVRRKRGIPSLVLVLVWLVLAWRGTGRPQHVPTLEVPLLAALLGRARLPSATTLYRSLGYFSAHAVRAAVEAAYLAELPRRGGRVWVALDSHQAPYWGRGQLARSGLSSGASAARLRFEPDLQQALAEADFVQENGPERADFKVKLFAEMDAVAPMDSILASSSSGIPMDVIQSACARPERCVIGHPFNPPHIVPLVEVVGGAKTSEAAIERALDFYASAGKKPIRLRKGLPGHAANRLQAALHREVLYLVQQGVLTIADADVAVCYGPGLCWGVMGPSLQWHVGGGEGGIRHFAEHLMDGLVDLMKGLEPPDVTPALKQTLIEGVLNEAAHRSIDQLVEQENDVLLGLLALRDRVGIEAPGHIDWSRAA